jgi:hypothetical protein
VSDAEIVMAVHGAAAETDEADVIVEGFMDSFVFERSRRPALTHLSA